MMSRVKAKLKRKKKAVNVPKKAVEAEEKL
jgi:hypothetical protein